MSDSLVIPWTVACQAPLSMGFPRQVSWSALPFLPPGDLSHPGIEWVSYVSCIGGQIIYHWATREAPIKRLLLMKGNHISQVKEFSAFLCRGRCNSLGSLSSFLSYASPFHMGSQLTAFGQLFFIWGGSQSFSHGSRKGLLCQRQRSFQQVFRFLQDAYIRQNMEDDTK